MATAKKKTRKAPTKAKPAAAATQDTTVDANAGASTAAEPREGPRVRKLKRRDRRKQAKADYIKTAVPLPNSFRIMNGALRHLLRNWKIFGGILLIYGLLMFIFVHGVAGGSSLKELKSSLEGSIGSVSTSVALLSVLVGSSGSGNSAQAGTYQLILIVIASLAVIWALRQTYAEKRVRIRDAFYRGVAPVVMFLLLLGYFGLQLVPFLLTSSLYGAVIGGGVVAQGFEKVVMAAAFLLICYLTLFFISSTVFALYIVTLPGMTPVAALKNGKQLVRFRRFSVVRKLLFMPIVLMLLTVAIFTPLLLYATNIAQPLFFIYSLLVLGVAHSYMYRLYREML